MNEWELTLLKFLLDKYFNRDMTGKTQRKKYASLPNARIMDYFNVMSKPSKVEKQSTMKNRLLHPQHVVSTQTVMNNYLVKLPPMKRVLGEVLDSLVNFEPLVNLMTLKRSDLEEYKENLPEDHDRIMDEQDALRGFLLLLNRAVKMNSLEFNWEISEEPKYKGFVDQYGPVLGLKPSLSWNIMTLLMDHTLSNSISSNVKGSLLYYSRNEKGLNPQDRNMFYKLLSVEFKACLMTIINEVNLNMKALVIIELSRAGFAEELGFVRKQPTLSELFSDDFIPLSPNRAINLE